MRGDPQPLTNSPSIHVSTYGIFSYIYHKNQPNVATYIPYMDPMGLWWSSKYWRDNTQFFHWIRLNPHGFSGEERVGVLTSGPDLFQDGNFWGHPGEKAMTAWYFRRLIRRYPLQLHFLGAPDSYPPWKLAWHWKITMFDRRYIHLHSCLVFYCHISFHGILTFESQLINSLPGNFFLRNLSVWGQCFGGGFNVWSLLKVFGR